MFLNARWEKVLRDIWDNRSRSLLVILTIAIGVAAVGTINNTVRMMKRDLYGQFAAVNPTSITLSISPFQEELAHAVEGLREVESAQAQRSETVSFHTQKGQRKDLELIVFPDYDDIQVNQLLFEMGEQTPGLRNVLLERNTANSLGITPGEALVVEMENGNQYPLVVSGIVHDITSRPYSITGEALGFVSMATLEWLGKETYYNQLHLLVVDDKSDRAHVMDVAEEARDRIIEPSGYQVYAMSVPGESGKPNEFWAKKQVNGILLVLQIMSVLAIFLSGGLVVNTISAILVQQVKQIGIMRSIGATRRQIIQIYLVYVMVLSTLGTILAIPLGLLGAWGFTALAAKFLNFNIANVDLSVGIVLLQLGLGLLMPLCVAFYPVLRETRISVYNAIYQNGNSNEGDRSWIETQLVRIRHLSPPIMLSLRNTFRNQSRLGFTLTTLTIAGAMFMAVFSSYSTVQKQIDELGRYIAFDASINIPGGANKYTAEREALRVPEVTIAEGWASTNGFIVHADNSESDRIEIVGLPENAQTIQPRLVDGRWLQPDDTWQLVVNEDLLSKERDIYVGSKISIKIGQITRDFEVIGIASKHMMGSRIYINYNQLTKITGKHNQVDLVRVLLSPKAFQENSKQGLIGKQLEKRFDNAKLSQNQSKTRHEIFASIANAFNILLIILLLVAVILALIGGLGLTGTMGLSVLERTREIGVLRAVGASHRSVHQVIVTEGTSIALLSWLLSAFISYPVGRALSEAVVRVSFGTAPNFQYSFIGLLIWLVIVFFIGVTSSLAPARDAARLTVREILNYE